MHLGHPLSGVSMPFGLVVPLSKVVLKVWASNGISVWVSILIDVKCVCDQSVCFLRLGISLVSIMLEQTLCKLSHTKCTQLTLWLLCVSTSLNEIDLAWLSRMEFYDFRFVMFLLATVSIVIEFNEQAQLLSSACEWPSCGQGLAIVCLFSGLSRCHSKPFHSQYSFLFIWNERCSLLHDFSHKKIQSNTCTIITPSRSKCLGAFVCM